MKGMVIYMKDTSKLILVVMIALIFISWGSLIKKKSDDSVNYKQYIETADKFASKGIYIDAISEYEKALALAPEDYDLIMKVANVYKTMGNTSGYINLCDKAIGVDNSKPEPFVNKIRYHIDKKEYAKAVECLASAVNVEAKSEMQSLIDSLQGQYDDIYMNVAEIGSWHAQESLNYVTVQNGGKYGIINGANGSTVIRASYDYIGAYSDEDKVIPCCYDGMYFYIDSAGNKKLVGDKDYQYLGSFGNGYAPAQLDDMYGYINRNFDEFNFEYDYAGAFSNGVSAVKKDDKWALLGSDMKLVTGFEFEDIKLDSYGYCSYYKTVVAKKDGKYSLYDLSGNKRINGDYDDIEPLASLVEPVAVKSGKKWGFITQAGDEIIEPQYDEAHSFIVDLAPVKVGENWGYINSKNEMVIAAEFEDALSFSVYKIAPVKKYNSWNLIKLCK